jgi:hypothetical protein
MDEWILSLAPIWAGGRMVAGRRGFTRRSQRFGHYNNKPSDNPGGGGSGGAGGTGGGTGDGGGAGDAADDDGGDGGDDPPAADPGNRTLTLKEAKKLIRQRDASKQLANRLITELGLEVEWDQDPTTGKRVPKIKGLEKLKRPGKSDESKEGEGDGEGRGSFKEQRKQLEQQHTERTDTLTRKHKAERDGLVSVIEQLAKSAPLRAALAAENAIDDPDNKGGYSDLIRLLGDRIQVNTEFDEESGETELLVNVVAEDGNPITNGKGEPLTIRDFVANYLKARPHLIKPEFRRGSGAGGHGGAGGAGGRPVTAREHGKKAAAALFGRSE